MSAKKTTQAMIAQSKLSFADGIRYSLARGWITTSDVTTLRIVLQTVERWEAGMVPQDEVHTPFHPLRQPWKREFARIAKEFGRGIMTRDEFEKMMHHLDIEKCLKIGMRSGPEDEDYMKVGKL